MPELVKEWEYYAELGVTHDCGPGPHGHRINVTVTGGEWVGERLKASTVGAAADFIVVGGTGTAGSTSAGRSRPSTGR